MVAKLGEGTRTRIKKAVGRRPGTGYRGRRQETRNRGKRTKGSARSIGRGVTRFTTETLTTCTSSKKKKLQTEGNEGNEGGEWSLSVAYSQLNVRLSRETRARHGIEVLQGFAGFCRDLP